MSVLGRLFTIFMIVGLFAFAPAALAVDVPEPDAGDAVDEAKMRTRGAVEELSRIVDETTDPDEGAGDGGREGGGHGGDVGGPGFADKLMGSFGSYGTAALVVTLAVGTFAGAGIFLTTRFATAKEVLKKPQRAMLYGCIKGNPGVNLKQLSEDFDMKTSTVLWHIRKLEAADLVRSQKANGLRVFYPTAGGVAAKRLGLAVAALSNPNAARILDFIAVNPGIAQKNLVSKLEINAGTVRWHLRKLKEMALMAELSQGRMCSYYATELGLQALKQAHGLAGDVEVAPFVAEAEATRVAPS